LAGELLYTDELLYAYGGWWLGCGALLAGAWLGLRDRASGTVECLAATPTPAWRRERARLAPAVLAAAAVFALGAGAVALAGCAGVPSARLALDGMLAAGLSGGVGLVVGLVTRSRVASLFAAAAWFLLITEIALLAIIPGGTLGSPAALAPLVFAEQRSVVLGFLPDPFWGNLAFLVGLLALPAVAVVALAGRREGRG